LCAVPGLFGARGAWGRDGVIVFAPSNKYEPGPLRSVPATGGESRQLTTVEPGESHRFPLFLPDGRHFLYTSVGGPSPGIYVAGLDDTDGRRLLADASSAHFAPATAKSLAHLLFIRDGNLVAQPFDTDRFELTGEPFRLLEGAPYADDSAAGISVSDDGTLSLRGGRNRLTDSRFTWFDRSGNVISHEGPIGQLAAASLSPDEQSMAVSRWQPGQWTTDLYLRDLTRGVDDRFTFQNAVDVASNAVWSPDGSRLLFSASPTGTFDLFWKETRSSDPAVLLLETENPKYVTDWSRDGRYVLYTETNPETQADLWYLPLEETSTPGEIRAAEPVAFLQTEFLESAGKLSPDGRWIAYVSSESGDLDVYVRSFPSGAGKRKISNGASVQPRWSPDGRELFYLTGPASRQTLMSTTVTTPSPVSSGGLPIFATAAPEPLFQEQFNNFHPAIGTFFYSVSADGKRFLVNHIDTTEDPVLNVVVNWQRAFGVAQGR
jgi:Tol biopolymer transport system component